MTHFNFWRLWFTCKAPATAWAPFSLMLLPQRLQNIKEQKQGGISSKVSMIVDLTWTLMHTNIYTVQNVSIKVTWYWSIPGNYDDTKIALLVSFPDLTHYSLSAVQNVLHEASELHSTTETIHIFGHGRTTNYLACIKIGTMAKCF